MIIANILPVIGLIFAVIMIFNVMIFIHELGHFWAARWRGLQVDRFQIWFGKPIISKTINGVQYGLGWLPLGGFVALPQMAPMESIEGSNRDEDEEPLPPISPLDKIIVAFAGPLFSFLLAFLCAFGVWKVGKPADRILGTEIGYVQKDSPADKAGLLRGDKILEVNGSPVTQFRGDLNSVAETIMLCKTDEITFLIQRPGQDDPLTIVSEYKIPESKMWQRRQLPQVGIQGPGTLIIGSVQKNSPADLAGLQPEDRILQVDGLDMSDEDTFRDHIKQAGTNPITLLIKRGDQELKITAAPTPPQSPADFKPLLGISYGYFPYIDEDMIHPSPMSQIAESATAMWKTITAVVSPKSKVGAQHLSGPVGIGKVMYAFAESNAPYNRLLAFAVLLNVNLAILNMLPLPVLDGGHITMALHQLIRKRPISPRILEPLMTGCALLLFGFIIYVTTKDIGDGINGKNDNAPPPIVWPTPQK